jgi:hypothetical protein
LLDFVTPDIKSNVIIAPPHPCVELGESQPRVAAGIKKIALIVRENFSNLARLIMRENFGNLDNLVAAIGNSLI